MKWLPMCMVAFELAHLVFEACGGRVQALHPACGWQVSGSVRRLSANAASRRPSCIPSIRSRLDCQNDRQASHHPGKVGAWMHHGFKVDGALMRRLMHGFMIATLPVAAVLPTAAIGSTYELLNDKDKLLYDEGKVLVLAVFLSAINFLLSLSAVSSPVKQALSSLAWQVHPAKLGMTPMQLGRDVEVRENIKGRGLYALRSLEAGELIERYEGVLVTKQQANDMGMSQEYAFQSPTGYEINAQDPERSNFVRYINHSVRRANCGPYAAWGNEAPVLAVYFKTLRRVGPGEELLFDYGTTYWDAREPRNSLKRLLIDYVW